VRIIRRNKPFLPKILWLILVLLILSSAESRASLSAALPDQRPANPDASDEAADTLNYLYTISGRGIISGQHDYLESPDEWSEKIRRLTGQHAGMHGYELGAIMKQSRLTIEKQRLAVVDSAIAWSRSGGLVTMTFHQSVPGKCACWSNVKTSMSQKVFDKYVTPGTPQYEQLIADLDDVAVYLGMLRDANVPVLWRPYHEMNGDWFWWGKKSNFAALWHIMYERFVNVHKLNNLLWVWSPNAPNRWSDPYELTYPGADQVDVLAVDIYDNDYQMSHYDQIVELAGGKPVAIGESGELPSDTVLKNQPKWAYMMTWAEMLTSRNSAKAIKSYYSHEKTLKRDAVALRAKRTGKAPPSLAGVFEPIWNPVPLIGLQGHGPLLGRQGIE